MTDTDIVMMRSEVAYRELHGRLLSLFCSATEQFWSVDSF